MEGRLQLVRIPNWKHIKGAARFFTRHPLLFGSALIATSTCMAICNAHFGDAHHRNNRANAFRHALWNMLLLRNALKYVQHSEKAYNWAETLTNWHEEANPNPPLAKAMDLHNNRIGRELFRQKFENEVPHNDQLTQALLPLLDQAVKITSPGNAEDIKKHLVYIID